MDSSRNHYHSPLCNSATSKTRLKKLIGNDFYSYLKPNHISDAKYSTNSRNILSPDTISKTGHTFLIRNPRKEQSTTFKELNKIFRNGSMADLHRFFDSKNDNLLKSNSNFTCCNNENYASHTRTSSQNFCNNGGITSRSNRVTEENVKPLKRYNSSTNLTSLGNIKNNNSMYNTGSKRKKKNCTLDVDKIMSQKNNLVNRIKLFSNELTDGMKSKMDISSNKKPYHYDFFQKENSKKEMDHFLTKSPTNNLGLVKKGMTDIERYFNFEQKKGKNETKLYVNFNKNLNKMQRNNEWKYVDNALQNIEKNMKKKKISFM